MTETAMMKAISSVSVVIPAYGVCPHLSEVVEALLKQTRLPAEIIVVHSGTNDPSDLLGRYDQCIRVFHSNERMLAGVARNFGLDKSQNDWVAFLDADVIPYETWLEELCLAVASKPDSFAVGSIGYADSGGYWGFCLWLVEFGSVHPYLVAREIESGASANMLAPRGAAVQVGGFAEGFQPGEDTVLHARLRAQGLTLYFRPSATVRHYNLPGFRHCVKHLYKLGYCSGHVRRQYKNLRGHSAVSNPLLIVLLWPIRFVLISHRLLRWGRGFRRWYVLLAPGILTGTIAWNVGFFVGARRE